MTTEIEPFDSDAVINKLYDYTHGEIPWTYKPDGHKEFTKWLNVEIEKFRQKAASAAYSEGRKSGMKEMYEAISETFNVAQFANAETLKLRQEYQSTN